MSFRNSHVVANPASRCQYDSHYVPAWTYNKEGSTKPKKSMEEAVADVEKVLGDFPRVTIIEKKPIESEYGKGFYSTFSDELRKPPQPQSLQIIRF